MIGLVGQNRLFGLEEFRAHLADDTPPPPPHQTVVYVLDVGRQRALLRVAAKGQGSKRITISVCITCSSLANLRFLANVALEVLVAVTLLMCG